MNKIKLSTAIREGAKLRPQSELGYGLFHVNLNRKIGSDCTGAAVEAVLGEAALIEQFSSTDLFPALLNTVNYRCSKHQSEHIQLCAAISHLEQNHRWSREKIADYIESLGY